MDAIIKFFTGLGELLIGAVDFLIGLIGDILYIVQLTAKAVMAIPAYLAIFPPPVIALLMTIFSVVVIYKILGREG